MYGFYPAFTETNVLKMIRNTLVEGLNARLKLPSIIVVLCADQLLLEDPLYLPSELERKVKWVLREVCKLIQTRKTSLHTKSFTLGEPRIMWVRAFQNSKRNDTDKENLLKFNNMLCRICIAKAIYTIPTPSFSSTNIRCFDFDNKTQIREGFVTLWEDIIAGIKSHDEMDKYYEQRKIAKEFLAKYPQVFSNQSSNHSTRC